MRRPDPSSIASRLAARITRGGVDRLWIYRDFTDLKVPTTAIAAALSRLTRTGTIRRLRRGVYYRPGTTAFGETRPSPAGALEATLRRRGVRAAGTGLEAWRRLGLTTQVTSVPFLATSRRLRLSPVIGHRVRIMTRPDTHWKKPNERAVLDALRALRRIPDATPGSVIDRVLALLKGRELDVPALLTMARGEPPRVRALLGTLLEEAGPRVVPKASLNELRGSLNPLTSYQIPEAAARLKAAKTWGIR